VLVQALLFGVVTSSCELTRRLWCSAGDVFMRLAGTIGYRRAYLYFILYTKIMQANTRVMPLAMVTGRLLLSKPNMNQNKVPNANNEYIAREMPAVFFVFMVCSACGKKDAVVQNAAIRPMKVINSLLIDYNVRL